MNRHTALAFDQILVSRQFVEDLDDIARDDPDGASKVARTVCGLLVDMESVNRRRIRNTRFKLFRTRPPGDYRSVDWPQGAGTTALLRVSHRRDIYSWVERYNGEVPESFLPVKASPLLHQELRGAAQGRADDHPSATSDPVPRRRADDPVGLATPSDLVTIAKKGMEQYLASISDEQREMLNRLKRGPAVIRGPAGSGKTVMALHLARQMNEELQQNILQRQERVLLLGFGRTLRENLRSMLAYLCEGQSPEGIEIMNIHRWCEQYLIPRSDRWRGGLRASERTASFIGSIRNAIDARQGVLGNLDREEVFEEITTFILRRRFATLSEYLEADRTGRGFPLRSDARRRIWEVYQYRQERQEIMRAWGYDDLINMTLEALEGDEAFQPYRYVIVDETQDFSVAMLRLARRLAGDDESRLFLFGDVAQSLYDPRFRWKDAELAIRGGQVRTLRSSHRCARRIFQAARVLVQPLASEQPDDYDDPDRYTHDGQKPRVVFVPDEDSEILLITEEIQSLLEEAEVSPQSIAVLAYANADLVLLRDRLQKMEVPCEYFRDNTDSKVRFDVPAVKLVTIHSAKGLGFPHVFLLARAPGREETDDGQQRKTLFTAMTRAGISLVILTPEDHPHPLAEELVRSGQAASEYPG